MPPVEAVKFSQGYNAVPSAVKIQCFLLDISCSLQKYLTGLVKFVMVCIDKYRQTFRHRDKGGTPRLLRSPRRKQFPRFRGSAPGFSGFPFSAAFSHDRPLSQSCAARQTFHRPARGSPKGGPHRQSLRSRQACGAPFGQTGRLSCGSAAPYIRGSPVFRAISWHRVRIYVPFEHVTLHAHQRKLHFQNADLVKVHRAGLPLDLDAFPRQLVEFSFH